MKRTRSDKSAANLICGRHLRTAPLTFTSASVRWRHTLFTCCRAPAQLHALNNNWAQLGSDPTLVIDIVAIDSGTDNAWVGKGREVKRKERRGTGTSCCCSVLALHLCIVNEALSSWKTVSLLIFSPVEQIWHIFKLMRGLLQHFNKANQVCHQSASGSSFYYLLADAKLGYVTNLQK